MDPRADSLGVCAHCSSFSDARSRVNQSRSSTFGKTNAVISSEGETDLHQAVLCDTDNVQDAVLHIAGAIVGGSISNIAPNVDRSSPAAILPEVFILPKRSRSCDGRVETTATITRYIQESGVRRTRGANISWKNDLRERDVNGHSSDLKSHKTPDLPQSGPDGSRSVKKDDYEPSHETQEVKIYMAQDQSTQTEPIRTLLGVLPIFESIGQPCVSISSSPTLIETKGTQKEEKDFWAPRSKRRRQDTEDVKPVLLTRYVVGDADGSSHRVSNFDASRWLSVLDNPQHDSPSNIAGVDAPRSRDRSDRQINPRPGFKRTPASAPDSLGRSEDLGHVHISASSVASALHRFNKIVPNCDSKKPLPKIDARKRFQDEPARCLANTVKGSRCNNPIAPKNQQEDRQQKIRQLLTELAAMNINNNPPGGIVELTKLVEMAVCHRQRDKLLEKLSLSVPQAPVKDRARPSASPITIKPAIKVKIEEVPSSPRMSDESKTPEEQGVQAVLSPVTHFIPDFTPWWDKASKSASQYLADYLPYQRSKLAVSTWVEKQASTPLTTLEHKTGSLYVYWNQANFGVYKIGYTTDDVGIRLRNWRTQCKHTAQQLHSVEVPNVRRLERLVHAELKDYRVKEKRCRGCKRGHIEWFNVEYKLIEKSIAFWTEWIRKRPYENVAGRWHLKEDAREELPQLCTKLSVVIDKESKEKSTTISPPRYDLRRRSATRSPSRRSRGS